ncbi:MAG: N-6 DNA methylase, partial [Tissierella sp.]|uniref:N-6 DNA methylase n=1 Tax=Tissierella sp. TaxID=41274 RepID=UPI003F98532A
MVRLVENERSWAIELISEINAYLSQVNLNIGTAGGETTINNHRDSEEKDRKVMFPDVLLYSDKNKNNLLQGWEIKLPDVPIHNQEYINDAQDKADKLGLNSTVLWNFKNVVLYVKKGKEWVIENQWNDLNTISSRDDVRSKQDLWKNFLKVFLNDLSSFYQNGVIENRSLVEVSNYIVTYLIEENKNYLAEHLQDKAKSNRLIDIDITRWWNNTKEEYMKDETNKYTAYSKNILLNWIIRFTFGNIISVTHTEALNIKNIDSDIKPREVNDIFQRITKTSDFYTIFSSQKYNEILPATIWENLIDFNSFLNDKILDHELMQKMLENSVSQYKREVIGQFTTPKKLVLLLLHSTVINLEGEDIDPCCGTGIIPKELMNMKINSGISEKEVHEKTWASDKMAFPLQIANMTITTNTSMNLINKIFTSNVFELNSDMSITLTSPSDGEELEYKLPKFTNILSNLPFVPSSIIEENEREYINDIEEEVNENSEGQIKFSRRSDFYFYIITYLNKILDEKGRIGVITSNSWLGTEAGKEFYKLLVSYYDVQSIIISGNKKWFPNANVMSSIIILEKKEKMFV